MDVESAEILHTMITEREENLKLVYIQENMVGRKR